MSVRMSVASPPMQREPLEKLREELDEERKGVPETEGPSREQEQGKEGHENPNFEEDASERPLRGLMKNDKRDTSESALQSLIVTDAHSSSEGNQETVRPIVHRRRSRFSRQKSTAESGSSKGLQLRISDSNPDVPNTSKKTLLLVSPLRTPRRSSAGSVLTFSEIPNTPRSSILTTPFAQDRRESGRILWSLRSERGTSERSPEDIPSPGIFQRLRGRREPPQSSPWRPPSVWGPPPAEDLPY
ncbi:hypothetical protein K439DRAFT_575763 [Ramaria rubella]|nr:hypothetical protein K439DRAFT_575763 [Ramaria rubella]